MLQELSIQDFAIIDKVDITFNNEMTVLTGETGAGKSIIIDALGLLMGRRASSEFIRNGKEKAIIQGLFDIKENNKIHVILTELGIEDSDELIIQRDLHISGRNVCRVNGILVNLIVLKKIGQNLIDIHGQNESQDLLNDSNHLKLLDSYDNSLKELSKEYQKQYTIYQKVKKDFDSRKEIEKQKNQKIDMLDFQVNEIRQANLSIDEESELLEEKNRLDNYQTIYDSLNGIYQILTNENLDIMGKLSNCLGNLQKISGFTDNLEKLSNQFSNVYYDLEDVFYKISDELDSLEFDENRLIQLDQRLELIYQLKRKYGNTVADILNYYKKIQKEQEELIGANYDIKQEKLNLKNTYQKVAELAQKLSSKRKEVSHKLSLEIRKELRDLYMGNADFKVKISEIKDLSKNGRDDVVFYMRTNVGESYAPLSKIASGGEISRIMLALKVIFARQEQIGSMVFDEVDTGVSGRVAQAIAEKMSKIATHVQVLTITHLPQVAAIAKYQYFILKKVINNRTKTVIKVLTKKERIEEIARMISGSEITKLALENAEEMLVLANESSKMDKTREKG